MKFTKTLVTAALLVFSMTTTPISYANQNDKVIKQAVKAYQKEDFHTAFKLFQPLAEQGNSLAQYKLGEMYYEGQGVKQDYQHALYWYQKAAEQGNGIAQAILGEMYYKGQGVKQDYHQAVYWFQKAAEQGYADAQYNLGLIYYNGQGVRQDKMKAKEYFKRACDAGLYAGCENYRIIDEGKD